MLTRTAIYAGLALILSSGVALADRGHGPKFPASYDLNGDGTITKDEVKAARTAEFQASDTSKDGNLSVAEVQVWLDQQQTTAFNTMDADQSGSLSQAEFVGTQTGKPARRAAKAFKFGDTDSDGALSLAEFRALKPATGELIRMFDMMDTNDDDQISETEYLTPPKHLLLKGRGRGQGQGQRPEQGPPPGF